jgi:phage tail tape-measure protein
MKRICMRCLFVVLIAYAVLLNAGCTTYPSAAEVGAARGAVTGAVVGQAIGRNTKSTMIGVGVGAVGGAILNDQRARNRGYYRGY